MKTLVVTARNIRHNIVEKDGGKYVEPEIEAVLTVYGKQMQFSGASYINTEVLETIRFRLSPDAALELAKACEQWADDAEKEAESLSITEETA